MSRAASYAGLFARYGRRVTIERKVANSAPITVENVRARIRGATQEEIASGISSTQRIVLILAEDVPDALRPLEMGDQILVDGARLTFDETPDDQTHRDGETLLAIAGKATGG